MHKPPRARDSKGRFQRLGVVMDGAAPEPINAIPGGNGASHPWPPTGWEGVPRPPWPLKATDPRMIAYLNGGPPSYEVLASGIQPFPAVEALVRGSFHTDERVIPIIGAAGTGKSTTLQLCVLQRLQDEGVMVISPRGDAASAITTLIAQEVNPPHNVLIALDDAGPHLEFILKLFEKLSASVHIIFACNQLDINLAKASIGGWGARWPTITAPTPLRVMTRDDATRIVSSRTRARLQIPQPSARMRERVLNDSDQVNYLMAYAERGAEHPRHASAPNGNGHPLLGAFLQMDDTRSHAQAQVRRLRETLQRDPSPAQRPLKAFTCIVALHAAGFRCLTVTVLSQVLNLKGSETESVIDQLQFEVVIEGRHGCLMTRHRAIAEAFWGQLDHPTQADTIIELLEAAAAVFQAGHPPELAEIWFDVFVATVNGLPIGDQKMVLPVTTAKRLNPIGERLLDKASDNKINSVKVFASQIVLDLIVGNIPSAKSHADILIRSLGRGIDAFLKTKNVDGFVIRRMACILAEPLFRIASVSGESVYRDLGVVLIAIATSNFFDKWSITSPRCAEIIQNLLCMFHQESQCLALFPAPDVSAIDELNAYLMSLRSTSGHGVKPKADEEALIRRSGHQMSEIVKKIQRRIPPQVFAAIHNACLHSYSPNETLKAAIGFLSAPPSGHSGRC